jgi:hypothetical protein
MVKGLNFSFVRSTYFHKSFFHIEVPASENGSVARCSHPSVPHPHASLHTYIVLKGYSRTSCVALNWVVFFLVSWGGVKELGTSATDWPIVPAPDDR